MCGLLLLDAAKKADQEFQTPYKSSNHTTRDSEKDVMRMTCYLIEEKVASDQQRGGCEFLNPLTLGAKKIAAGYIEKHLNKELDEESFDENREHTHVEDFYEL